MQRTNRLTACYKINDHAAFDATEWPRIHGMFKVDDSLPFSVTAVSMDNEMTRVQLIEEALERYGETSEAAETIQEIIQCPDLSKWSWPIQ